jgi:hypothetical protein
MTSRLHFLDAPRIIVGAASANASPTPSTSQSAKASTSADPCCALWSRALFLKPQLSTVSRRRQDSDDARAQRTRHGDGYATAAA